MSKATDPDLMMLADGELDAAEASAVERAGGAAGAAKVAGIREVGDLVRGHLELSADAAEDRLAGLWSLVERRLDAAEPEVAPAAVGATGSVGLWTRITRWMDGHRGHLLTGALSAGAVAALTFMLRSEPQVRVVEVPVTGPVAVRPDGGGSGGPDGTGGNDPIVLTATPPEVESLEVSGGTGTVFTIEDDDGGSATAVIWVTPDDALEGI